MCIPIRILTSLSLCEIANMRREREATDKISMSQKQEVLDIRDESFAPSQMREYET